MVTQVESGDIRIDVPQSYLEPRLLLSARLQELQALGSQGRPFFSLIKNYKMVIFLILPFLLHFLAGIPLFQRGTLCCVHVIYSLLSVIEMTNMDSKTLEF